MANKKAIKINGFLNVFSTCLAERVGFEPTVRSRVHLISSQARSATPAPLRDAGLPPGGSELRSLGVAPGFVHADQPSAQGETVLTEIRLFQPCELSSILDNARPGRYNAPRHPPVRDPALEPARDRPPTRCRARGGTLPGPDGGPSLPGGAAEDRPHPVVCRHLERPVAGAAEFLRRGLEVRGARRLDRVGFPPPIRSPAPDRQQQPVSDPARVPRPEPRLAGAGLERAARWRGTGGSASVTRCCCWRPSSIRGVFTAPSTAPPTGAMWATPAAFAAPGRATAPPPTPPSASLSAPCTPTPKPACRVPSSTPSIVTEPRKSC